MNNQNKSLWQIFIPKPIKLFKEYERWKKVAKILKISKKAELRLDWIIYYYEGYNATQTARHFGISRKTFHKWFKEFDRDNLYSLYRLEDKSKAPTQTRKKEITQLEEQRIVKLRKKHICWGKMKIAKVYKNTFKEEVSSWKVQYTIESFNLYPNPIKTAKQKKKRQRSQQKKKITELKLNKKKFYQKKAGYIICLDTVEIRWNNIKRYIFTSIDKYGKVAYARMYKNKSSKNNSDFLLRLYYLLDGEVTKIGHDNGTEFEKHFKATCEKLNIQQYYSRVRTPTDNPNNERFNRTLQEEFIQLGNFNSNPEIFNRNLTEWLIEYNFKRPHQALNYETPMEFSKVLPMYSSRTFDCYHCSKEVYTFLKLNRIKS